MGCRLFGWGWRLGLGLGGLFVLRDWVRGLRFGATVWGNWVCVCEERGFRGEGLGESCWFGVGSWG